MTVSITDRTKVPSIKPFQRRCVTSSIEADEGASYTATYGSTRSLACSLCRRRQQRGTFERDGPRGVTVLASAHPDKPCRPIQRVLRGAPDGPLRLPRWIGRGRRRGGRTRPPRVARVPSRL